MIPKQDVQWKLHTVPSSEETSKESQNEPFTDEDIERLRRFFVLVRSVLVRLEAEGHVIKDGKIIQPPRDRKNRTTHT